MNTLRSALGWSGTGTAAALLADAGLAVWAGCATGCVACCAAACALRAGTKAIARAIQEAFHLNILGVMIRGIGSPLCNAAALNESCTDILAASVTRITRRTAIPFSHQVSRDDL